jgi:hypothetical protein
MISQFIESIFRYAGSRKLRPDTTFVADLQTGEGAAFSLKPWGEGPEAAQLAAKTDLEKHRIWVCPMYEFFLGWLYAQRLGNGAGDITELPRYVQLSTDFAAMSGYRRGGGA